MAERARIEMFLDVSCPYCHAALETNRRLLDELAADPDAPAIELQWRFMRLHELAQPGRAVTDLLGSYGDADPATVRSMQDHAQESAARAGVRIDETRYTRVWDPLLAHRLLAAVRDDGGADLPYLWSLARVVFSANFVLGVDISDHAALRGAVERGGLAVPRRIWELIASEDGHLAETLADRDRALQVELDGVPRLYVDGRIVPTWIGVSEARQQLREALGLPA